MAKYFCTIEKFWVNPSTQEIIGVDSEHEHAEGIDVPLEPLKNGWVRGGLSGYTECYHLEAPTILELQKAIKVLNKNYSSDYIGVYYDITEDSQSGQMGLEETKQFLRTGQLPQSSCNPTL
jgi:hypothetical protein